MTTQLNRRGFLRAGAIGAAALGAAALAIPSFAGTAVATEDSPTQKIHEETYKGRHIAIHANEPGSTIPARVLIDGTELHIMVIGDTRFVSMANHYQPFESFPDLARAAVDNLSGLALQPGHHHHG